MASNRVGQQLGNYQLVRLLKQGGFAEVYLAQHIYLETEAAIKIVRRQLGPDARNNFFKEARTIARLVHPHIIRILDFGVADQTPFLVMDYAPNGTLRERYPKGSRLPLSTIVSFVRQVASALQYAHDQHLVHCDVKPENMLLGRDGEILLSDFGIALVTEGTQAQNTSNPVGTVAYVAPEQILSEPRPASDQYSLGITIYEWLCGERPFRGTLTEIIDQQLSAPPPSLREKIPDLPPDVAEVVEIALTKDPARRFASIAAFANALGQACLLEEQLPSAPIPTTGVLSRPVYATLDAQASNIPAAINMPPIASVSAPPQPYNRLTRRISRRTTIAGTVGVIVVAISGATATLLDQALHRSPSVRGSAAGLTPTHTPQATATPTPTPPPLGTVLYTYHGHHDVVKSLVWSPLTGSRIASASFDSTVQIWDATTGEHVLKYTRHTDGVKSVTWSPINAALSRGSLRIASGSLDKTVWDTASGQDSLPPSIRIASGGLDKTVRIWDAATGQDILPPYVGHSQAVRSVVWSPDGSRIASGGDDRTVQVWDVVGGDNVATTGKGLLIYRGHTDKVNDVAWSPATSATFVSGHARLASASFDGTVQVWDVVGGDNVAVGGDSVATTGKSLFTYHGHFPNAVRAVAWSPDGKYIASGGSDTTVQIWDAQTGALMRTCKGHTHDIQAIVWSPDGNYLASGSFDFTVKVWAVATGHNVYTYTHHTKPVWAVAWSPDGQHIASGAEDSTVQVWQAI